MWTKSILLFLFNYSISVLYGQAIDKSFVSPLSSSDVVFGMALQPDGKIIIGGNFSTSGIISRKLVRLNPNGTIDSSFNVGTGFTGSINEITLQTDGKLLVGGFFTALNNRPVRNLIRLLPDGTLDNSFNIGTGVDGTNNSVQYIKVDENGKIYVGGDITRFNGKSANMLIRLNANGTLDSSFTGTAEYRGRVITFAFQPDGKILVGGVISKPSSPVVAMIRLESNGSLDNSFVLSSTTLNSVNSIVVLPNNKILAGGDFQNYNGKPYSSIVRLEANGAVDESFSVGTGFYVTLGGIYSYPLYIVSDMLLTNEGKILVAGYFREYNKTNVDGIIQLNADGSINNTFQACNKFGLSSGNIYDIAIQPNGRIIVGGYFIFRNDPIAKNIFRLLPDPPPSGTPVSNFDFTIIGNEVSFIDSSKNTIGKEWDFNDGTYSTVSNPVHNYAKSGIYNVRLTARGLCDNTITLSKRITIVGLQSHFPTKGGNNGSVIITINGAYFTDKSTVKLLRNGSEISGRDILLTNNGKTLYATLDLYDKEVGLYDMVVTTGTNVVSLRNSFTIEQGKLKQLSINIDGRDTVRTGSVQKYNIVISNQGNTDARGVPVWLAVPKGSQVNFDFTILVPKNTAEINYDSVSLFAETDTLFNTPGNYDVYGFIVRNVPSGQAIKLPLLLRFMSKGDVYSWIYPSMYNSALKSEIDKCLLGRFKQFTQFTGLVDCPSAVIDAFLQKIMLLNEILEINLKYKKYGKKETEEDKIKLEELYKKPIVTYQKAVNSAIYECIKPDFLKLVKKDYPYLNDLKKEIEDQMMRAWGNYKKNGRLLIPPDNIRFTVDNHFDEDYDTQIACETALEKLSFLKRTITTVGSMDPNEKVGPSGVSAANHILPSTPFNYTIHFENISTATAPAQEVIIIDTLNKSVFDIKSFQLNDFGFGRYATITINPGLFEYAGLLDLRPSRNVLVKVNAKLDTAKGILTWRFFSVDPKTLDLPEDPFAGFLPPNNADNDGQGFVSYSITPKTGLSDNTILSNKALIYFDYNTPIATNTFYNTIDINKPKSKVELLQPIVSDTTFKVIWGGSDVASGVRSYDVYYSINNGLFKIWKYDVSATEGMFTGKLDSTYNFYSIAKDYAGNTENAKQSAEATTQVKMIVTGVDNVDVNGHFYLYPNPSQHTVNIDFNFPTTENLTIVIRDIMGRIIVTILSNELTLAGKKVIPFNTFTLPKGVYLCELKSNKYNKVLKFIKE